VVIGWTGHRPELFADRIAARASVVSIAAQAAMLWPTSEFVCGGQRGVDMWAAAESDRVGMPPQIHLVLPTRIEHFAADWPANDRAGLEAAASRAKSVTIIDESCELGTLAFDLRNEVVARRCDLLVAVWTGVRQGGTFFTMEAARRMGKPVVDRRLPPNLEADWTGRGR